MRADLDTLLPDAGRQPDAPLDADALWVRGRRRRAVRRVSAAGGSLAGIAALALVATSLVDGVGPVVPEITPMAPSDGTGQDTTDGDDDADEVSGTTTAEDVDAVEPDASSMRRDQLAAADAQRLRPSGERRATDGSPEADGSPETDGSPEADSGGASNDASADDSSTTSTSPETSSSPTPDWSRAADPCAVHDPDDVRAFIDVVSPVGGQQIDTGAVALVGCASVYEGTVRYRISRGGTVVEDSFATATAGGPELGEFRREIALRTTGTHTLEVFWDSPADGEGERDMQTMTFEVG